MILFEICGIASAGVILVRNWTWRLRVKPFNCEMCMSFWLGVMYYHSIEGVLYSFLAAAISIILNKYI